MSLSTPPSVLSCANRFGNICFSMITAANTTLFVLGCLGAAGHFSPVMMGKFAVGFGTGIAALSPFKRKISDSPRTEMVIDIILQLIPIILGALAMNGILSAKQVGWGIVALPLAVTGLMLSCCCAGLCGAGIYFGYQKIAAKVKSEQTSDDDLSSQFQVGPSVLKW